MLFNEATKAFNKGSAMEYLLIMNLFLYGQAPQAGMGGASVATEKFETLEQCLIAKNAFLNMKVTPDEIGVINYRPQVNVVHKADCVDLRAAQRNISK